MPKQWQVNGANMKIKAWNIYLRGKWIDTVFYDEDCDYDYVLRSLINHDGYSPSILIIEGK